MDTARSIVHSVTHYIKNTDLYLMLLGLVCSIYGMLLIYSATLNPVTALDGSTKNLYVQGAAIILGLAAFVALSLIDLENLGDLWKIFVIGNILLQFLLFTPLGTEVNGQRAWLNLGVTSLQPGELGKLIFIFIKKASGRPNSIHPAAVRHLDTVPREFGAGSRIVSGF